MFSFIPCEKKASVAELQGPAGESLPFGINYLALGSFEEKPACAFFCFVLKMHNLCYGYVWLPHYSGDFWRHWKALWRSVSVYTHQIADLGHLPIFTLWLTLLDHSIIPYQIQVLFVTYTVPYAVKCLYDLMTLKKISIRIKVMNYNNK